MSKRKITNKKLLKGRFYIVHEGSKAGQPGMIYWKRYSKTIKYIMQISTNINYTLIFKFR